MKLPCSARYGCSDCANYGTDTIGIHKTTTKGTKVSLRFAFCRSHQLCAHRQQPRGWTVEEADALCSGVEKHGSAWGKILIDKEFRVLLGDRSYDSLKGTWRLLKKHAGTATASSHTSQGCIEAPRLIPVQQCQADSEEVLDALTAANAETNPAARTAESAVGVEAGAVEVAAVVRSARRGFKACPMCHKLCGVKTSKCSCSHLFIRKVCSTQHTPYCGAALTFVWCSF